jgi:hypothetical protein
VLNSPPHPAVFHQVFILKEVKVVCFDTLLEVLILKGFTFHQNCAERGLFGLIFTSVISKVS